MASLIVKALQYNKITLAEGFQEFDVDQDGFISTKDLLRTAEELNLLDNLSSTQILEWHAAANVSQSGKLKPDEWHGALEGEPDVYRFTVRGHTADNEQCTCRHYNMYGYLDYKADPQCPVKSR